MMTLATQLAAADPQLAKPGAQNAALRDYDSVRRAIAFISEHWRRQPDIEAMADAAAVTPDELHHLFRRWAGLTPKDFMQALTLDHAKGLLRDSASVLDAALDSGLSGPGRLHDLFVTHEAMSPGEWKNGGAGMTLSFGFHPSPFGTAIVIASGRGLAGLAFADAGQEQAALSDMKRRWPNATFIEDNPGTAPLAQRVFDTKLWRPDQPLRVVLIGTDFEVRVWETLLKIPMGKATTYSSIAANVNSPKASRAVGAAVGKNPVSFVVPCHRVIGKSGALTGYHWGITRKQAMLGWEAGRVGAASAASSSHQAARSSFEATVASGFSR
ncbi:MAG: bifunctional helix-turn-helix domain-containing protein/methylated-DNA--[protein]-cysteine S-methyltransferase [Proteobacteria bacterium]|nr:bifunctional helix-turn-helix domain-containing protein/methylated-DNA--[protein]-cysteine S-methyltransferase [Pseudomonadota bacterium]